MTIDEAIKICEEDAEKIGGNPQSDRHAERCMQLAEWLKDYKLLRGEYFKCQFNSIDDYRREAARCRAAYFSLSSAHSHLTIRLNDTYQELQEAKRLLKLAVEDYPDLTDMWRYADKAKKLLND